jgi:hypothetical protein
LLARSEVSNAAHTTILDVDQLKDFGVYRDAATPSEEHGARPNKHAISANVFEGINLDVEPVGGNLEQLVEVLTNASPAAMDPAARDLRRVEPLSIRVVERVPRHPVLTIERLDDSTHHLHVLLRHRPPSIRPGSLVVKGRESWAPSLAV